MELKIAQKNSCQKQAIDEATDSNMPLTKEQKQNKLNSQKLDLKLWVVNQILKIGKIWDLTPQLTQTL